MDASTQQIPRVVVFGLASCFGCQLQITNAEKHLTEVLGQIDLRYWQMASSAPLPQDFDVAIIEGAVVNQESLELVQEIRARAKTIIAIGACAVTGGVPQMAASNLSCHAQTVYGETLPSVCGEIVEPRAISEVVPVDYVVRCCPIDPYMFISVLQRVLYGSNRTIPTTTMCTQCKINGTLCRYEKGDLCLGLITDGSCGARCIKLGRACNGCAGMSADANLASAVAFAKRYGFSEERFLQAARMFNKHAQL